MDWIHPLLNKAYAFVSDNIIDWLLTGFITFFATRSATKEFFDKNKRKVAHGIMEKNLRDILKLQSSERLPLNAKVIFVEYTGRCYQLAKNSRSEMKCRFLEKIRKTVLSVGADISDVSSYRPIDYGILGIANLYRRPMLYDFTSGELIKYENGLFIKMNTEEKDGAYYYKKSPKEKDKIKLSEVGSSRGTMIALPICKAEKLYGGVTFDMASGNEIYQHIFDNDSEEMRKKKNKENLELMVVALDTADRLLTAYFSKKARRDHND